LIKSPYSVREKKDQKREKPILGGGGLGTFPKIFLWEERIERNGKV